MAKNTATGAKQERKIHLSKTRNMKNFTTPIFQNADIRIRTIRLWSIA